MLTKPSPVMRSRVELELELEVEVEVGPPAIPPRTTSESTSALYTTKLAAAASPP